MRDRVSKTPFAWGSTKAACQFSGSWQTSNALALQASLCGSVTHRLHQPSLEGCRAIAQRRRAIALAAICVCMSYASASQFGAVIQQPDCKSGVMKQCWKRRTGALPALPTSLRQSYGSAGHLGLVAQSAERPVVCGRVEGAIPFGSAILSERSSVFRAHLAVCQHLGTARSRVNLRFAKRTFCFGKPIATAGAHPAVPTISSCCRGRIHQASVF